jgi:hypothetical protein
MEIFERMALAVFVVSLAVHLLTFVPGLPMNIEMAWMLQVLSLVAFLAALFLIVRRRDLAPLRDPKQSSLAALRALAWEAIPGWAKLLAAASVLYAVVNHILFMGQMDGGSPYFKDGGFYLYSRGEILRELTRAEYARYQLLEVRGFSGQWVAFSCVAWTLLRFVCPRLRKEAPNDVAQD